MTMTNKHLLYWLFDFLEREHPDILQKMLEQVTGDAENPWVHNALAERYDAFKIPSPVKNT